MEVFFDPKRPVVVVAVLAVAWPLMSWFFSVIGGWWRLSDDYSFKGGFEGRKWYFQSASFRFTMYYSGVLIVGATSAGLYLAVLPFFRIAHPPLLIPWKDITKKKQRFFFLPIRLVFAKADTVSVGLSRRLITRLETYVSREIATAT